MEKYFKYGFFISLFALFALTFKMCENQTNLKNVKIQESNLRKALTDTLHHFQTKEGNWGVEKRTLQADLSSLKDQNLVLTDNQKKLIKQVEEQNKNGQIIAAALIDLRAEVADIKNDKPVVVTDTSAQFVSSTENFEYDISVFNVKPIELKKPTLSINKISFPNTQTISFHWKDEFKKEGYPISFSVINSNPLFRVNDIESYVLPEIKKETIKPTFLQKLNKTSKTSIGKIGILSLGIGIGFILAK